MAHAAPEDDGAAGGPTFAACVGMWPRGERAHQPGGAGRGSDTTEREDQPWVVRGSACEWHALASSEASPGRLAQRTIVGLGCLRSVVGSIWMPAHSRWHREVGRDYAVEAERETFWFGDCTKRL